MEKLAEGLQKLDEDSLLLVVQMIHDNKTDSTYVKNDVEREFFFLFFFLFFLTQSCWNVSVADTY